MSISGFSNKKVTMNDSRPGYYIEREMKNNSDSTCKPVSAELCGDKLPWYWYSSWAIGNDS